MANTKLDSKLFQSLAIAHLLRQRRFQRFLHKLFKAVCNGLKLSKNDHRFER